jgi:hypothetical protein
MMTEIKMEWETVKQAMGVFRLDLPALADRSAF